MKIFDSHAHYDDEKFDGDRKEILQQIQEMGVEKIVSAGYSIESSKQSIKLGNEYDFIYSTCGISPNDIPENEQEFMQQLNQLEELLHTSKKIVAIGEIGLDYYWNKENKELQKYAFIKQIELANKYKLPIVIHTREAMQDTLQILKKITKPNQKVVFHCCPLNVDLVKEGLELGFYISFAGPITFKNSKNANTIIEMVPLNRMLIETDSPYLAPEPNRGTRNNSSNLIYIIEKIASQKGIDKKEIANNTYKNAIEIFNIK